MSTERRQDLVYPPGPHPEQERDEEEHWSSGPVLSLPQRLHFQLWPIRQSEAALEAALRISPLDRFNARMVLSQLFGGHYTGGNERAVKLCERVWGPGSVDYPIEREWKEEQKRRAERRLMPPVATLAEAQAAYLKGRVEVLRERLAAMARDEAVPSRPEFLTLLWGMEDGVARAALAGLAGMPVSAERRGRRDLYDALSAHFEAEATYFATTPVGRKRLAPLPGAELLRSETKVLGQVGGRAGGLLLGSWDEAASQEERAQREALCQQVLAEGHPALKMLGQGDGEPVPEALRARMERLLGHDFAHVRIHIDVAAAEAARLLGARALALGTHIYFGAGQYAPGTPTGDRLLVHELVHVVQFDQGRLPGSGPLSHRDDPAEQEARAAERQVPALASGERSLVLLPEGNPQAPTALPTVPANRLGKDGAGAERGSGQVATAASASATPILRQEREEHLPEIVIVAHGLDFQRQGHDLRVEVYWWWLLRQDGQQHRPLRGDEEPPAIANPRAGRVSAGAARSLHLWDCPSGDGACLLVWYGALATLLAGRNAAKWRRQRPRH